MDEKTVAKEASIVLSWLIKLVKRGNSLKNIIKCQQQLTHSSSQFDHYKDGSSKEIVAHRLNINCPISHQLAHTISPDRIFAKIFTIKCSRTTQASFKPTHLVDVIMKWKICFLSKSEINKKIEKLLSLQNKNLAIYLKRKKKISKLSKRLRTLQKLIEKHQRC